MQKRPNFVVFFTDQQRWDASGLHGNPLDLMPNFDRLASRGTHIANFFTCQSVCGPARSCLQTGQYATTTGCWRNGIPLRPEARTLAHYFQAAGYATGYIGKWHLAAHEPVPSAERGGYDYWLGANALEMTSEPYLCRVYDSACQEVVLPGYRVDALTDAAIRFVATEREQPFFLFLSFLEPHHQNHLDDYTPPDGYRERYTGQWTPPDLAALPGVPAHLQHVMGGSAQQHLGGYWGMVKRLDEALGRLMDALKSLALDENTIVLFTSDHGCHFKTRNDEYKRSCHEASIRVPCALWGQQFNGGGQISQLVSLVDLPPTLLTACAIEVPEVMQGRSILPLLQRQPMGWPEEVLVQISESQVGRAVRTQRWKYGVVAFGKDGNAESGSDLYQEAFLYDLAYDPYELTNLIGFDSHRAVATKMQERLLHRMTAIGEPLPRIEYAAPRHAAQRRVSAQEVNA